MSHLMPFNPSLPHTQVRTNNGIGFANVDHNGNIISHAAIPQQNGYAPVNPNSGARHQPHGFPNQGYPNMQPQNYAHPAAAHYAPQMQQPRQDAWLNAYNANAPMQQPMAPQTQVPIAPTNAVAQMYNRPLDGQTQTAQVQPTQAVHAEPAAPKAKPTFISAIGGILGYQKYRGEEMAFLDPDDLLIQANQTRKVNHFIALSSTCGAIAMPVIYRGKITEVIIKGIRKMDIAQHLGRPAGIPESSIIIPEEDSYAEVTAKSKREMTISEIILDAASPDAITEYALLAGSSESDGKLSIIKVDCPISSMLMQARANMLEDVQKLRLELSKTSGIRTFDLLEDFRKNLAKSVSPLVAMAFSSHLTKWLNKVIRTRLPVEHGINKLAVDDFFEDYHSLIDVMNSMEPAGTVDRSSSNLAEILDAEKQSLVSFTFTEFDFGSEDISLVCFSSVRLVTARTSIVDRYETGHVRQDLIPSLHDLARSSFDAIDENFVVLSEKMTDLGVPTERIYEIEVITESQIITIQRGNGVPGLERMFISEVRNRY